MAPLPTSGLPADVRCARDYERLAAAALDPAVLAHLAGGSGDEAAVRRNRQAFERLTVTPRVLRRLEGGHTRLTHPGLTLGGRERSYPIFLAPVAHQALFHPRGELETARGAAAVEAGLVVSTLSSFTLEEIAQAAGPDRWFQLYVQPEWPATLDLVRRAEAAGYGAIVLTVDTPIQAPSLRSQRAGFRPDTLIAANLTSYPAPPARTLAAGDSRILQGMMGAAPGWGDLERLVAATTLPVWVKGVMHPDDAAEARACGAAGVIVSNHGGRALDDAPATLAVLPRIRAALREDAAVLLDGGIGSGGDVFKALALGADGVLVGRLQACSLSVAGALGVGHMIKLLREELELCMALAGCATLADIRKVEVAPC